MRIYNGSIMGVRSLVVIAAVCSLALNGCGRGNTTTSKGSDSRSAQASQAKKEELSVVSGKQMHDLVRDSSEPVLVEFGVTVHCVRCDKMRPQMGRLASEFEGRAKVVRVDFIDNRQLAAKYGGEICPTYVIFRDGKPLVTRSYPTSADLLSADLNAAVSGSTPR